MKIEIEITRKDLWRFNLFIYPKRKQTWFVLCFIWAIFFFSTYKPEETNHSIYLWLSATLIISIIWCLVWYVIMFSISIFFAKKSAGNLGKHTYTITDNGLLEETQATSILNKWPGISKLYKSKQAIYVPFTSCLYHIIPKRCFNDQKEYSQFYDKLCTYIK